MRALAITALALAVAFTATNALADKSVARERFEEGRALLKDGKPREAIPKFLASLASEPTAAAALNLADAYERIGQTASAYHRFRQVEQLAKDKDPVRAQEAKKRADSLYPRLATIDVVPANNTDVRVSIDGAPVERATWGDPQPYDLGPHEVVVEGSGRRVAKVVRIDAESDRIRIDPDELLRSDTTSPQAPPTPVPSPPPVQQPEPESSPRSPLKTIGVVTAGAGIASAIAGGVFGALALGAKADLKSTCPHYPSCPPGTEGRVSDLDDRARARGDLSTVFLAVGGGLIATGVVLYLVAPKRNAKTAAIAARNGFVFSF